MSRTLNFQGIELNIEKAIKRVRMDIRDDWFQDPFKYEDVLNFDFIWSKLKQYDNTDNHYKAGKAIHIDIPKPGFTSRYSTETNIIDRVMYQAMVDYMADEFDKCHSPRIYSHRVNIERSDDKYFFRYAIEEWKKFLVDASLELHDDKKNTVLLLTDLSNFYENIGINDMKNVLELLIPNNCEKEGEYKKCIYSIFNMLKCWCEKNTKRGIPQNRDASAFLANIFLNPVDSEMQKSGFNYFRYMDDIRIVCKDKYEARKALKKLIVELRKKGLNVNSKKTRILDNTDEKDRQEINESLEVSDDVIQQIEVYVSSKKLSDIRKAATLLKNRTYELISQNKTLEREFRYCINRLQRIARNKQLSASIDFKVINQRVLEELVEQPWATDTFSRYLSSVELDHEEIYKIHELLTNPNKNIYEWQCYYLWNLLIRFKYYNTDLIKHARNNIEARKSIPVIASSALYLSALGDMNDRKFIAENFKNFDDSFSNRLALIAVKDLSYEAVIKPLVQDYIKEEHIGSFKILVDKFKNLFQLPLVEVKEEEVFEDLEAYNEY